MVCRSRERGEVAQKEIVEKTGNRDVHLLIADMSSITDVRVAALPFADMPNHECRTPARLDRLTQVGHPVVDHMSFEPVGRKRSA